MNDIRERFVFDLDQFFCNLFLELEIQRKIFEKINLYLAEDLNLIDLINPNKEENKVSDLIALLLDPSEKHGQGDAFLKSFIKILKNFLNLKIFSNSEEKVENLSLINAKVDREYEYREKSYNDQKNIRFADLFLDLKAENFPVIAIENKIYAKEQPNQICSYFEWLRSEYGDNFILIFLTVDGRPSQTASDEVRKFAHYREVSYSRLLIPWLEECIKVCKAEKVRYLLRDFILWIKNLS